MINNNVEVINNCQLLKIDDKNKKIYFNGTCLNYDGIFYYTPLKKPSVLKNALINPFYINQSTLHHSIYENIFFIGNITNSSYSFDIKRKMIKNIAQNILWQEKEKGKFVKYE